MTEKDYLKKLKDTKECETAKAWHEIFMADVEEYSKKLKEKNENEKDN